MTAVVAGCTVVGQIPRIVGPVLPHIGVTHVERQQWRWTTFPFQSPRLTENICNAFRVSVSPSGCPHSGHADTAGKMSALSAASPWVSSATGCFMPANSCGQPASILSKTYSTSPTATSNPCITRSWRTASSPRVALPKKCCTKTSVPTATTGSGDTANLKASAAACLLCPPDIFVYGSANCLSTQTPLQPSERLSPPRLEHQNFHCQTPIKRP